MAIGSAKLSQKRLLVTIGSAKLFSRKSESLLEVLSFTAKAPSDDWVVQTFSLQVWKSLGISFFYGEGS